MKMFESSYSLISHHRRKYSFEIIIKNLKRAFKKRGREQHNLCSHRLLQSMHGLLSCGQGFPLQLSLPWRFKMCMFKMSVPAFHLTKYPFHLNFPLCSHHCSTGKQKGVLIYPTVSQRGTPGSGLWVDLTDVRADGEGHSLRAADSQADISKKKSFHR